MKRRWAAAAVLAGAAGLAAPLPLAALAASPAGLPQWSGTASADGTRAGVVVNDFLVVSNIVDVGGPVAQASVSALQGAQGLAADPYPGDIVLTAHGLSQGAAPDYPLIAQSNNANTPNADASHGPYVLQAHSTDDTSSAIAQVQPGSTQTAAGAATSKVSVVHAGSGAVTSTAESTIEGITVAGVLHIGRVHSYAQLLAAPGAPAKPTADTEVADVSVGGQQVGFTDKGLVLAGTDVPLPPSSTANALLSSAGVTVHYVEATRTASSIVAPGVAVSAQQNVPGVGLTTVTYWFGQAAASAQSPGTAGTTVSVTGIGGVTGGTAPASTGTTAAPPALGSAGVATAPSAGAPPVTAAAPTAPGYRLVARAGASSESLYAVLAGGAVVMVAAAQVFRLLAVRLTWT